MKFDSVDWVLLGFVVLAIGIFIYIYYQVMQLFI